MNIPRAAVGQAISSKASAITLAGVIALGFMLIEAARFGWRHDAALVIGTLLGATLYLGSFGFTAMYRRAILDRNVAGPLAQILMVGLATILFAPFLARGTAFGQSLTGAVAPASVSVGLGSLMFGIGMQLGSGCASGTLYAVGGGSPRMVVTLAAFCLGSFVASLHMNFWGALPSTGPILLGEVMGWPAAVALQVAVLLAIAGALIRSSHATGTWRTLVPRNLVLCAVALAVLNALTLIIAGHPWTITWAFTLWGAKTATLLGWTPPPGSLWMSERQATALHESVFADITSLMDFGLVLGAFLVAAASSRIVPNFRIGFRALAASILGGAMMGYGARIAYGCNIGAFVSGMASTSLHGWLWIAWALPGNWLGTVLRPAFGLDNARTKDMSSQAGGNSNVRH